MLNNLGKVVVNQIHMIQKQIMEEQSSPTTEGVSYYQKTNPIRDTFRLV